MATWGQFAEAEPKLAEAGRALFYTYGVGLAFLATVRPDGGPRLHPIVMLIADSGLFAFLVPSPKRDDLRRDPRYAMHAMPPENTDDEFYVTGRARLIDDPDRRRTVIEAYPNKVLGEWSLFEFEVDRALHAAYRHRGDWPPTYTRWRSS
jgi:hypothetical protein